jgi:hypothetical protein
MYKWYINTTGCLNKILTSYFINQKLSERQVMYDTSVSSFTSQWKTCLEFTSWWSSLLKGTRRLISVFTTTPITIEFNSVHILIAYPVRFIIIRFPYLCLGFPGDLFPWGFPIKSLVAFLIPVLLYYMSHPFHYSWMNHLAFTKFSIFLVFSF